MGGESFLKYLFCFFERKEVLNVPADYIVVSFASKNLERWSWERPQPREDLRNAHFC